MQPHFLDNLDQPLIVFLFGVISQLREKNLKMFPVKKVCNGREGELDIDAI